jgi:hypothetical protein
MTTASGTLPTFIVIGAAKAGTTSLWQYLKAHPDVFMSQWKEPEFFAQGERWRLGVQWYASLFERGAGEKAIGEASVAYSMFPRFKNVPARMHRIVPDVRLVYVIRHPIDRMISAFRNRTDMKTESKNIDEALLRSPHYVNVSSYALQIEHYLEHFERSQLLVITSDDLAARRSDTLRSVYTFIGVDPEFAPDSTVRRFNRREEQRRPPRFLIRLRNTKLQRVVRRAIGSDSFASRLGWQLVSRRRSAAAPPAEPSDETRRRLTELLQPDLERLRMHLGPDFHCWGLLDTPQA